MATKIVPLIQLFGDHGISLTGTIPLYGYDTARVFGTGQFARIWRDNKMNHKDIFIGHAVSKHKSTG